MELLNQYFDIQQKIYNYFEYKEDWEVFPLSDDTNYYWHITNDEIYFAENIEDFNNGNYYSDSFYYSSEKSIYRKEDYTMVIVDTQTDGNKFLSIFDNSKELKENPINEENYDEE